MIDATAPFGAFSPPAFVRPARRLASRGGAVARYLGRKALIRWFKLADPVVDVEADGLKLRLRPKRNLHDRAILLQDRLPEAAWRAALFEGLPPGGTFVDVGANVGLFTLEAARRLGPEARLIAIEPHPVTRRRLADNLALNGLGAARIAAVAVGEEEGRLPLYESTDRNEGAYSLLPAAKDGALAVVEVPVRPLAAILRQEGVGAVAALKIDVEGFEDRALIPFLADWPAADLPARLLIEHKSSAHWRRDALAALASHGYREAARDGENALLVR